MPDTDDLRLLAEIINNGSIGLPQAAWNARMSQTEAAARFVTMAERGMPLRLVAEGDRQLLWRIAQAGPATGGFPLPGAAPTPEPAPASQAPAEAASPSAPAPDLSSGQIPLGAQTGSQAAWAAPEPAPPMPPAPAAPPVPVESQPVQQIPLPPMAPPPLSPPPIAPPPMVAAPLPSMPPVVLPPASAVPPHEQAIAGAVPLGQPPFGASDTIVEQPAEVPAEAVASPAPPAPPADVGPPEAPADEASPGETEAPGEAAPGGPSTWGLPGTSAWVRADEPEMAGPEMTQSYPPPSRDDDEPEGVSAQDTTPPAPVTSGSPVVRPLPPLFPPSVLADFTPPASHLDPMPAQTPPVAGPGVEQAPPAAPPIDQAPEIPPTPTESAPSAPSAPSSPSSPTSRVMISGQPTQSIVGLFGEHLDVSLMGIIDPADAILTSVGYRLEAGERALLVQTSIGNRGPIDYESLPDLYLVLVGSTGDILPKAAMAVGGYPAHRVGVPANSLVAGWTVFLVPASTEVTELRWSVRPDLANRTVTWGFGPA